MELRELLHSLHEELRSAGISAEGSSASLAFVAKKDRKGKVTLDFVDAGATSKPRSEEIHHLQVALSDPPAPAVEHETEEDGPAAENPLQGGLFKTGGRLDLPPAFRQVPKPPALPPKDQE